MTDITEFLTWLATSAGASVAFAFITERLSVFQSLSSRAKEIVHLVGPIAFALIAYAVLTYVPAEVLAQLAPIFQIVAAGVTAWVAGQVGHTFDPANHLKGEPLSLIESEPVAELRARR